MKTSQQLVDDLENLIIDQEEDRRNLYDYELTLIREAREHLTQWMELAEKWGTEIIDAKEGVRG